MDRRFGNYNFSQSEFLRVLEEKKILVKYVEVGDNFNLGGLKISVFNPSLKEKLKDNESSVVFKNFIRWRFFSFDCGYYRQRGEEIDRIRRKRALFGYFESGASWIKNINF